MYIVILASTPDVAERIQTALGETADRYTVAAAWPDVTSSIEKDPPDLIVVERAALAQIALASLTKVIEPGRWPPLLLVGASTAGAREGVTVAQRLAQEPRQYQVGELRIDTQRKRATVGDRWIALPPIQYRLLLALAKRAGEVVGCQELLREVWGYEAGELEARELVKVHIRQIRRRLGLDPEKHHYIHSVRGFGYMLAPPEDD
jgi:DNA-binding winged helix-turn-helix (wHTH) protein